MLEFYQKKGLSQSDLIIQYAEKSYKEGEIGYIELLQNISQALDIRFNYLDTLYQFNQTSINLEYILGGNK
jgi:cobalt-zinc-cadmium resistance protein CzcA